MSDVFISYARSGEEQAKCVETALRGSGYSVWRDTELPAHRTYAEVIEERLKSARAVVVLWSAEAAKSQWVRAEADAAREIGTLVQASVDGSVPPLPFNQIHCADLKGWEGDTEASGWQKLHASVAALAGQPATPTTEARERVATRGTSICVLPFVNMSGDPEQEYFSDGITEDITTDLCKVSALSVVARNTAFTFKGVVADAASIARKLSVSHILEGSVRKAGGQVRITAQLVSGTTGDHLWAERYDRNLTDIFAIQDEISKAIVEALKVQLLPEEKRAIENRGTTSAEAYNLYLLARQYWVTGNLGDSRREERTERIARRATEIDPQYARAWALMALAQATLKFNYERSNDGGLAAAKRAISLDPTVAEAYCVLARHHAEAGQYEEADAQIAKAIEIDSESWDVNKEAARLCMLRRQIKEARKRYEKAVDLMETDYHSWALLQTCCQAQGDGEGARRAAEMMVTQSEKAVAQDPSNGSALGIGACGLAALGQADRARDWMERAMLVDPDNLAMRYNFVCILASHLNDKEAALQLLERNFERVYRIMIKHAETDPDLDSLRDDPRFQKLIADAKARSAAEGAERISLSAS